MVSKNIVLENESGMHARPASELAKTASKYKCDIELVIGENKINAKSVLKIMSAGIKSKTPIEIICSGEDENQALEEILDLFKNNFGE